MIGREAKMDRLEHVASALYDAVPLYMPAG